MDPLGDCRFQTERLQVAPWHANTSLDELASFVSGLLTPAVTAMLPPDWSGPYDPTRASTWIGERDAESTSLLAQRRSDGCPIGLLILADDGVGDTGSGDVHLGYLVAEDSWRLGFAGEMVAGLVDWCRATGRVRSIAGGVAGTNTASMRVLTRLGFTADEPSQDGEVLYRLRLATPVTIRPERQDDHGAIREVVVAAFGSAVEGSLVDRIRASPEYMADLALVAEIDREVVGHVMISGAVIRHAAGERPAAMLSPLAVAPSHQRRGIGAELVRTAIRLADGRREPLIVLEGNPAYYGRFGFEHSVRHGLTLPLPDWARSEAGQVKLLDTYDPDDRTLRGEVVYPAAFDGLE